MEEAAKPESRKDKLRRSLDDLLYVKQEWDGRNVDPLLQGLVNNTNINESNEFAITLTIGGNLVSGILISSNAFMDLWADEFASNFSNEDGVADRVRDQMLTWKVNPTELSEDPLSPQFLHLKEAEVFTLSGRPILPGGALWRGKLASVDGFNLTRLVYND